MIKKNTQRENAPLSITNEPYLVSQMRTTLKESELRFLLYVIAETLDAAANGHGSWLSIGRSQDGATFMLTYHEGPQRSYATGPSLRDLAINCRTMLEDVEKL